MCKRNIKLETSNTYDLKTFKKHKIKQNKKRTMPGTISDKRLHPEMV